MGAFALIREAGGDIQCFGFKANGNADFVIARFDGSVESYTIETACQGEAALKRAQDILNQVEHPLLTPASSHDQASYRAQVERARSACEEGALEKVVLSRRKAITGVALEPLVWFERLQSKYPQATVFMLYRPGYPLWMGATPECLLDINQSKVRTMSLAGTRPVGTPGAWGNKEREEQFLVTKDIVNMLQVMGCRDITVDGPVSTQAGPVEHLCSTIEAKVNRDSALQLARALHPTPAVGGLPRAQAQAFIRQHEGYDRQLYTGYFGWQYAGRAAFFVNLRCMEIGSDGLYLYAGGGITKQSHPQAEWEETEAKLGTLQSVIYG